MELALGDGSCSPKNILIKCLVHHEAEDFTNIVMVE